jgi:hypothetical protein
MRQCRQAFIAYNRPLTTAELREWCYPDQARKHWHYAGVVRAGCATSARCIAPERHTALAAAVESRRPWLPVQRPLSGVERTYGQHTRTDAIDPFQRFGLLNCCCTK